MDRNEAVELLQEIREVGNILPTDKSYLEALDYAIDVIAPKSGATVVSPAEAVPVCENCKEYETLFCLQHKRMIEASDYWRKETGADEMTYPDLGQLLSFLLDKIKKANK